MITEIKNPSNFKVLDISTSHISHEDAIKIQEDYKVNYGWLVPVFADINLHYDNILDLWGREFSRDFINLVIYAHLNGYDHILFDPDGEEYEEIPRFDWL